MTLRAYFTLPSTFDATEFLRGRLQLRADDARWLVSTIVRKMANRDTDPWGLVRLHSEILGRVMHRNRVAAIVEALEAGGAIETSGHCAGVRTRGYRLAKRFLGDRSVRVPVVDPWLRERIERERHRQRETEQRTLWRPVHHALHEEQQRVTVTPEADGILDTLPNHTRLCQHVLVTNIRTRSYSFSVSTTGRVFNCLTGLKREMREAVRIDGQPMGNVDIRCAQFGLLAAIAQFDNYPPAGPKGRETYKYTLAVSPGAGGAAVPCLPFPTAPLVACSDFSAFCELVGAGLLYDTLAGDCELDVATVKRRVLVDVLAKRGRYASRVELAFRERFPTVYGIIRRVNRGDHAALIRLLQRAESWLVIDQVAPRLLGRVPIMTLHDAIYSPDVSAVESAFHDSLDALDWQLALKVTRTCVKSM